MYESYCCSTASIPVPAPTPTVVDNTCIICPGGATEGDDYAPYTDADGEFSLMISGMEGNPSTCAELIDTAKQYEPGSEGCAASEIHELYCCPSVPEDPCIICPNGVTHPEGDDHVPNAPTDITDGSLMTCGELIYGAALLETESDYCRIFGEIDESDCCPPEVTPSPTPMPEDDTTVATTTTSSTSAIEVDNTPAPADDTIVATTTTTSTSAPEVDDPCIICPNGITAGNDFVPNASSGNSMTCLELINSSMDFESGSQMCSFSSIYKISCCPTTTAPTSADTVNVAAPTNTPTETPTFAPTELPTFDATTPAPIPAPADDTTTVATTTTSSTWAPEVENPCIICPNGATAGRDDFQPFAGAGETKTCMELLDDTTNVAVEAGSDLCESLSEIEALCCGDVDSAPSPVEPLTASPASGTMTKSSTDPSSGGASVSGLVDVAFISIVSTICIIACL